MALTKPRDDGDISHKSETPVISPRDCILAETRGKVEKFIGACAFVGALGMSSPALSTESPYVPLADASGNTTLVLKDSNGTIVPPTEIPSLFKRLGYDDKTIVAVTETAKHMEAAQEKLGESVVLGGMRSESHTDKPKILKDITNNPEESFSALFGTNELTLANHEAVFERILPDKFQIAGYKKRVIGLGPDMTNAWFQTFNAVVQKMPTQNVYLLQQTLITTSSIYSYNNPTINIASLSPSVVADQLHRLMLLISDEDFTVARLVYGESMDKNVSRRLPNRDTLKKIFGDTGITLPEALYDIAESGAREMGIGTDKYVDGIMKDRGIIIKEQSAATKEQSAYETEKRTVLMRSTNELFARIDTNLQTFIKKPNTPKLVESIRADMIALRALKSQWETLPMAQKETKAYQESMRLIASIEQMVNIQRISI